jgi:N-acetylglucosamine-6-phosphate deacetylase
LLERLLAAGDVGHVTLAPELPGALDLVDLLHERGVTVSLGHSDATAEEANVAFDRGVRTVTHLFNAMRPIHARDGGLAGAALARDDVQVQLILDGHHLADETARLACRAAAGRLALVTDAGEGASLGDGRYRLGPVEVEVQNGAARRPDGVLAGSVLTMIEAVRNLHALGAPLIDAVAAATAVPARIAGRPDLGVLVPGGRGDVVVLDDRLEISRVVLAGESRVLA